MWPIIAGLALGTLIVKAFSKENKKKEKKKRIFISFAIEDIDYRKHLVAQAKNERSPFYFIDMSVKKAWEQHEWQEMCRKKIKRCDGMIVLLSKNTWKSSGSRWEIKCAVEEKIPVLGMHIFKKDKGAIPPELPTNKVIEWTWDNIEKELNKM